jgi:hypothetical protein
MKLQIHFIRSFQVLFHSVTILIFLVTGKKLKYTLSLGVCINFMLAVEITIDCFLL